MVTEITLFISCNDLMFHETRLQIHYTQWGSWVPVNLYFDKWIFCIKRKFMLLRYATILGQRPNDIGQNVVIQGILQLLKKYFWTEIFARLEQQNNSRWRVGNYNYNSKTKVKRCLNNKISSIRFSLPSKHLMRTLPKNRMNWMKERI